MSIQDVLFLIGWYLFIALVMACVAFWCASTCEKRREASENLRKAWGDFTMSVAVAIIGDRQTQREREIIVCKDLIISEWEFASKSHRANCEIKRCERDHAIYNWKIELQHCSESSAEIERLRVDHNNAFGKLMRKHDALRKRYNTLRHRTISKTQKRKAKAKTKR